MGWLTKNLHIFTLYPIEPPPQKVSPPCLYPDFAYFTMGVRLVAWWAVFCPKLPKTMALLGQKMQQQQIISCDYH